MYLMARASCRLANSFKSINMAEIRPILYGKELQKQIFPDSSFYKRSIAETGVADNVETVEKPVQAKISKAKEGSPSTLPIQIETSTDGKKTYPVVQVYAAPLMIDRNSQLMTDYNKRQAKQQQQADEINLKCANIAFKNWSPLQQSNIVKTSGAGRATNVIGLNGNRKAFSKDDIIKIKNMLLRMNVSGMGGKFFGLLTADAYTDLLGISEFVDFYKTGNQSKLELGIVGTLMGIEFMTRSTDEGHAGGLYNAAGTTVYGADATIANDMLPANLFWNDRLVCRAEGVVQAFINEAPAGFLGATVIETVTRFGADKLRDDEKGVISVLESAV